MPHDKNGKELQVGSTVLVPCIVRSIHKTEEYCNVDLETEFDMFPGDYKSSIVLNSKQTILQQK